MGTEYFLKTDRKGKRQVGGGERGAGGGMRNISFLQQKNK